MKKTKVTLADIARHAGVSKSTVSFVLNGHAEKHRITEETVKKVLAVVEQYQYAPSVYARALKSKKTFTIGLVIPDFLNMGFATIAKELEKLCRDDGYQLLIASSDDDSDKEKLAVNSLAERQVDLLMVASCMTDSAFYDAIDKNIPVLLFDRVIKESTLPSVATDARVATKELVSSLIDKTTRECFFFGGLMELSPGIDRLNGYREALQESSLGYQEGWVMHRDYQPESGYIMMKACIETLGRLPDAVFTSSYSILEGVLRYLTEKKLFGNKVNIGTFDNYSVLDCLPVGISSIEQDCTRISQVLFEMMKARLKGEKMTSGITMIPALHHIR